jgi:hypothetical protein
VKIGSFIIICTLACQQPLKAPANKSGQLAPAAVRPYTAFCSSYQTILLHQQDLSDTVKNMAFFTAIDSMSYYWKGTRWDYNGTSRQPGTGSIACGYFVCHVLSDLGYAIPIRRYATEPSAFMIKRLCYKLRRGAMGPAFFKYLQTAPNNSVHLVGLDFHTGLLLKDRGGHCWLLHSFYRYKVGVVKESAERCDALRMSKSFLIGQLRLPAALSTNLSSQ